MKITLDELKAENAAKESEAENNQVKNEKEIIQDEYVEVKEESKADEVEASAEDEAKEETELESWQLTEETETSESESKGKFVPNHEAALRRKKAQALKGELKEANSELEELRKQVEELKAGNAPQAPSQQTTPLVKPTREQFDYDDDAYEAAIEEYYDKKFDHKLNSHQTSALEKQQQEAQQKAALDARQQSLDNHYERASKLVADGKVTAESYKNADSVVRRSLDSMFPQQGDNMTDALISTLDRLGEGSEKVMYQLGVNPAKMQELQNKLAIDPSGLAASAFLGQLQSQIQTPTKRRSQAPAPSSKVDGEGGASGKGGTLQKQYSKTDDLQTRLELKRKAKSQGIDVSNW